MKNHKFINGKLLQTNKKFYHLKESQKEWISIAFRNKYESKMKEYNITSKLSNAVRDEIISEVYKEIEEKGIWIPFNEVKKYCCSKTNKIVKSFTLFG